VNKGKRRRIFEILRAHNPQPTTELEYRTPFQLLIAVILSAQATDVSVNRATKGLFARAGTPGAILSLGLAGLKRHIRTIGLFNTKAANIMQTCAILMREYGGEVPDRREDLERLPGVGRKTANVILNTAFGQPTIAVDTHIFRVCNRTGIAPGKDVRAVEDYLVGSIDAEFMHDAHHWLILHGRYTCTARRPMCGTCPIRSYCEWPEKGKPEKLKPASRAALRGGS